MNKHKQEGDTIRIDIPLGNTSHHIDIEAIEQSTKKHRKYFVRRFIFSFFTVTMLFLAVAIAFFLYHNRDILSSHSFKVLWNDFWGIELDMSQLDLNLSSSASFIPFQGGIVACDASGLRVIDTDGIETLLDSPLLSSPMITHTNNRFLAFDSLTHSFTYSDGEKSIITKNSNDKAMYASISQSGLSFISQIEGYLSSTCAYDINGNLLVDYRSPNYFGILSLLSQDARTLVFVGLTSDNIGMMAQIIMIDIESASIRHSQDLGNVLPLGIKELSRGCITVLTDKGIATVSVTGDLLSTVSFEGQSLMGFGWGDDFCMTLFERNESGKRYRISTWNYKGDMIAFLDDNRIVNAFCVNGSLVALSYENRAEIYPLTLDTCSEYSYNQYIDNIAVSKDGRIVVKIDGTLYLS